MRTIRRRYYFWLFKAYFKRWKRVIGTFVLLGILLSAGGIAFLNLYVKPSLDNKVQRIGLAGVYTPKSIPENLLSDVSYGLTHVKANGTIEPGAAESWSVSKDGKTYTFHLRHELTFHNREQLTATTLPLDFRDSHKKVIDNYTVAYTLASPFSPFLSIVSRPILLADFSGLGNFKVSKIDLNAGFVKSMFLQNTNDRMNKKIISFYPTQSALRTAYMLGEIDYAKGLTNVQEENIDLSKWTNTSITKSTDYTQLVSLFYNNADGNLSNKKARQALNYALPEKFEKGQRADSPIPPTSIYYAKPRTGTISDAEIAREVLASSGVTFTDPLEISTTPDLEDVAKTVAGNWNDIGVKTKIKVVDIIPSDFQILLYAYKIPQDPDQYTLWHSDQINNIGHYKNLRIDKLLEDGRVRSDEEERLSIYADFQKYLLDDVPASFLYFPYEYTVSRKF